MFTNWGAIIFELVIFFLLCIQMYIFFSQLILPWLRKQIAELYKRWKDLQEKLDLSLKTKKRLKKQILEQITSLDTLKDNIEVWHATLLKKKKVAEKKQIDIAKAMHEKKAMQLSRITILKAKQKIIPQAIESAKAQLQKEYAGEKGKKSVTHVINEMVGHA